MLCSGWTLWKVLTRLRLASGALLGSAPPSVGNSTQTLAAVLTGALQTCIQVRLQLQQVLLALHLTWGC